MPTKSPLPSLELTQLRTTLGQRDADAWFDIEEAAVYCGLAVKSLRKATHDGRLPVDGRGARLAALFRKRTLDDFLANRPKAARWS